MSEFYQAFEQRLRGSRKLILGRLEVYASLAESIEVRRAIDLGCGRGEWLELLRAWGIHAFGVDLDAEAVASSQDKGLDVRLGEALGVLKEQEDSSLGLVTAFHLVEHLPFQVLQDLVSESLRALVPGGLLILETPNPENLLVGASEFYLDPTHQRPLPSKLLAFLVEYTGFERVEILRLQEPWKPEARQAAGLLGVLAGVSMDYAVVALKPMTKPADDALSTEALDRLLIKQPGVSIELACREYDQQLQRINAHYDQKFQEMRVVYDKKNEELHSISKNLYGEIVRLHGEVERIYAEFAKLRRRSPIVMIFAALGRLKRSIAGSRPLQLSPLDECNVVELRQLQHLPGDAEPKQQIVGDTEPEQHLVGDAEPLWKASEDQQDS
ncbi:MAG: methyltransferase domain-containing protein [Prochlorococcaceae cyanobacterium]